MNLTSIIFGENDAFLRGRQGTVEPVETQKTTDYIIPKKFKDDVDALTNYIGADKFKKGLNIEVKLSGYFLLRHLKIGVELQDRIRYMVLLLLIYPFQEGFEHYKLFVDSTVFVIVRHIPVTQVKHTYHKRKWQTKTPSLSAKSGKALNRKVKCFFISTKALDSAHQGIYEKNDANGTYFPENFYLWIEDHDDEYFEDISELCDYVKEFLDTEKELNTLNDCNEALDEHSERTGVCFSLAEFEIVDN